MKNLLIVFCLLLSHLSIAQKGQAEKAAQERQRAEDMAKLQEMMAGMNNAETRPVILNTISMVQKEHSHLWAGKTKMPERK